MKQYAWPVLLGIAIVAFLGFDVKTFVDDHNRDKPAAESLSRADIVQQFATTGNNNPPQSGTVPRVTSSDVRGPQVLGESIGTANPDQFKPYRNDSLGFETMVPPDTTVNATATEATAISGVQQKAYWTITVYSNTTETLNSIINELSKSPSVTRLTKTTLGGKDALRFDSPKLGGTGYAVVSNGRLYYLIGNFSDPLLLKDFKFL